MPFDPSLDAAGARDAIVVSYASATIKARYPSARDGLDSPAEGFFDTEANAQTAIDARGALIGVERRRFAASVSDLLWIDPTTGVPSFSLADADQAIDATMLVARIEIDLDAEITTPELFG
jgi:hypothetical protein